MIESDVVSDAPIEQTFNGSGADISIPGEVVGSGKQQIRMASFLFKNVSGLLPESLGGTDDNRLVLAHGGYADVAHATSCVQKPLLYSMNSIVTLAMNVGQMFVCDRWYFLKV